MANQNECVFTDTMATKEIERDFVLKFRGAMFCCCMMIVLVVWFELFHSSNGCDMNDTDSLLSFTEYKHKRSIKVASSLRLHPNRNSNPSNKSYKTESHLGSINVDAEFQKKQLKPELNNTRQIRVNFERDNLKKLINTTRISVNNFSTNSKTSANLSFKNGSTISTCSSHCSIPPNMNINNTLNPVNMHSYHSNIASNNIYQNNEMRMNGMTCNRPHMTFTGNNISGDYKRKIPPTNKIVSIAYYLPYNSCNNRDNRAHFRLNKSGQDQLNNGQDQSNNGQEQLNNGHGSSPNVSDNNTITIRLPNNSLRDDNGLHNIMTSQIKILKKEVNHHKAVVDFLFDKFETIRCIAPTKSTLGLKTVTTEEAQAIKEATRTEAAINEVTKEPTPIQPQLTTNGRPQNKTQQQKKRKQELTKQLL